jgi:hypothetical protein
MSAIISKGCRKCGGSSKSQRHVLVVQSPADLALLKSWRRHYDVVQVRLPRLPEAERARIDEAIKDYFACGCVPARWAAIAVVGCAILASFVAHEIVFGASWDTLVIVGLVALLVPLATMLVTVVRARRRLWRTLDGLVRTSDAHC